MAFADGGDLVDRLHETGDSPTGAGGEPRTGTTVRFWPDPSIFDDITFRAATLTERFQMMAFLNAGLRITFRDERPDHSGEPVEFHYEGGIRDFVRHVNAAKEALFTDVGYFRQDESDDDGSMEVRRPVEHRRNDGRASPTGSHHRGRHARRQKSSPTP